MRDLAAVTVPITGSLVDAMQVLDDGQVGVALVTEDDGRLVGTLTDGDVRRALLRGATLGSWLEPFVQRTYAAVEPDAGRAEVMDLMQARRIEQVPVLDAEGRLVGLHLLHELVGPVERPNWAVVMAGGLGTRLRPLTDDLPKPMLRVAGRPILERIVLHLVGQGIRKVYLSINYLGHLIQEHFGDGSRFGCQIEYLREDRPMGTGGALGLLPFLPAHPLLVMNGDLVTQANVGAMLDAHEDGVTVGVRQYDYTVPYGCVEVSDWRIVRLDEKPQVRHLVNAGVYVLSPDALPPPGEYLDFPITAIVEEQIRKGRARAFELDGDWLDVGQHDQLRLARGAA